MFRNQKAKTKKTKNKYLLEIKIINKYFIIWIKSINIKK